MANTTRVQKYVPLRTFLVDDEYLRRTQNNAEVQSGFTEAQKKVSMSSNALVPASAEDVDIAIQQLSRYIYTQLIDFDNRITSTELYIKTEISGDTLQKAIDQLKADFQALSQTITAILNALTDLNAQLQGKEQVLTPGPGIAIDRTDPNKPIISTTGYTAPTIDRTKILQVGNFLLGNLDYQITAQYSGYLEFYPISGYDGTNYFQLYQGTTVEDQYRIIVNREGNLGQVPYLIQKGEKYTIRGFWNLGEGLHWHIFGIKNVNL